MSLTKPTVAVLGLGAMGHAFASNLVKGGFPTRVWNRTPDRADDLVQRGAVCGATPGEAARGASVVISVLPDQQATESVLLDDHHAVQAMEQDAVLAQIGTIGVAATERLLQRVGELRPDVVLIDAPVSGTKGPAEQGQVRVLASGDPGAREVVQPVFDVIGKDTRWLGEAGAGSRMKLVVNAWLAMLTQGLAESTRLAGTLGFSPDEMWACLDGGPLAPPYARIKLETIKQGSFEPQFQLKLALKDVRLALEAAGDTALPALAAVAQSWDGAVRAGDGDKDLSVVYRHLGRAD